MKVLLLRECSEYEVIYGIVILKEGNKVKEFQEKIYEIKNSFNYYDWCIDDVFERLHDYYDFDYFAIEKQDSLEI